MCRTGPIYPFERIQTDSDIVKSSRNIRNSTEKINYILERKFELKEFQLNKYPLLINLLEISNKDGVSLSWILVAIRSVLLLRNLGDTHVVSLPLKPGLGKSTKDPVYLS